MTEPRSIQVQQTPDSSISVPFPTATLWIREAKYIHTYDQICGDPELVTVIDLAIPAFLNARPNFKLLRNIGEDLEPRLDVLNDNLKDFPSGVDLWDWPDNTENRRSL